MTLLENARVNKRGTILKRSLKLIFQQANFNRYIVVERISSLACARVLWQAQTVFMISQKNSEHVF